MELAREQNCKLDFSLSLFFFLPYFFYSLEGILLFPWALQPNKLCLLVVRAFTSHVKYLNLCAFLKARQVFNLHKSEYCNHSATAA